MSVYTITITLTPEADAALRARAQYAGSTAQELLGQAARTPLAAPRTNEAWRMLVFRAYLDETARAGDISEVTAGQAWKAWLRLSHEMNGCLPVPDAAPGNDGELVLAWDRDDLHLELEFLPDGPAEFFSRDRATGVLRDEEYQPDAPLSAGARERLGMFLQPMRQPRQSGPSGELLPPGEDVLRLIRTSKDGKATEAAFTLSEEDKLSVLQSWSIFARQLTNPHRAFSLKEPDKRAAYQLYAILNVYDSRALWPTSESPGVPSLDVAWDPLPPPPENESNGATGYAGITGLRSQLTDIANQSLFPLVPLFDGA